MKLGLLHLHAVSSIPVSDLESRFLEITTEIFDEQKGEEMRPVGYINSPIQSFMVFPDFSDDKQKEVSMKEIRNLIKLLKADGYAFVTEMYFAEYKTEETNIEKEMKLLSDLDYKVSMLPQRIEGLLCLVETKIDGKIKASQTMWKIVSDPEKKRKLIDKVTYDTTNQSEGKMSNMLV